MSASTLEQMAKYSKGLWPSMPTLVRAQPDYLLRDHRYLDAAWANYLHRRGNVKEYIRDKVNAAQDRGCSWSWGSMPCEGAIPTARG